MSFDGIKRAALERITAGSEGARLIGSQLTGVTGNNIQVLLEGLLARVLPSGGTTGQVLKKTSATDYAASWQAESATTPASETASGVAEIATQTETNTGTDDARIVTPLKLASRTALDTRAGVVELATDTETQTGTDTARAITPANLSARSATETRTGVAEIATQTETDTGTDDARIVTPLKARNRLQVADLFSDFVVSGFNPSLPGATLTMTTPAGVAYIGGVRASIAADTSRVYTASRDTYLDVNASGTYTAVAVTNGAAEPAVTASSLRILKVVTSGTQVTSIVQRGRYADNTKGGAFGAFSGAATGPFAASDGAEHKATGFTVEFDSHSLYDSTNSRYVCGRAGLYIIQTFVGTTGATAASNYIYSTLKRNGVALKSSPINISPGAGLGLSSGMTFIVYGNVSDYFELFFVGYNGGTGTLNVNNANMAIAYADGLKNIPAP